MNVERVPCKRRKQKTQYKHSMICSMKQYVSTKYNQDTNISEKLSRYKKFDVLANFQNDLTYDWFYENIHNKPCTYCGDNNTPIGVDRINNNKGHTKDNVVPSCHLCNITRANRFTHEEMLILGEAISIIKKNRT